MVSVVACGLLLQTSLAFEPPKASTVARPIVICSYKTDPVLRAAEQELSRNPSNQELQRFYKKHNMTVATTDGYDIAFSPSHYVVKRANAISKLAGEYYCRVFSEVYGLKTACLRYFNVYGPRQNPHSEYAAVIPRFVTRILAGKQPVIYGDGGQTRDFTFVKDVVKANILAGESSAEGVFNIACGQRVSLNELAGKIMEITGVKVEALYEEQRAGDVRDSLADISEARKEIGYEPGYELDAGLRETVEWFRKN